MAEIKPDLDMFAKIKVIGCGGGGNSAVNRMVQSKLKAVDFISINTDIQALQHSLAPTKINIGKTITKGLGAGMDPELARRSAEESQNEIKESLKGADMVFITAGMGGGTGSGSAPVVANIAKELGALTIAVVTKPFSFEGAKRMEVANNALAELSKNVDTVITIPNDRILQVVDKKTSIMEAFALADEVLKQGISGITEIITQNGIVNVDFADVKKVMKNAGSALMGVGNASGENKAVDAAKSAINSPLLEVSIDGAKGILFTVTGGPGLSMNEIDEVGKIVTESADPNATIIFGAVIDQSMKDDIKVTVIATGFSDEKLAAAKEAASINNMNSFTSRRPNNIFVDSSSDSDKKKEEAVVTEEKNDDNDELEVPSFIRKKMGE